MGHQSEIELANKLKNEVDAERLTRLDKMLFAEQRDQGIIDLRLGEGASHLVRENRNLMLGRVQTLKRYGLASETEPGRWIVSDKAEVTLRELGERNDIITTMHRALADHGLAEQRGMSQYACHGERSGEKVIGRVLAKGLAGDEMGERVYLIIDGVDGRVHHVEFADATQIDGVHRSMIVEAAPAVSGPRPSDRNIAIVAEQDGIYRPSQHLDRIRARFEQQGKDPDAFVRSHVHRLEALRRAGHVERLDENHWRVPKDITGRGQTYDLSQGGDGLRVRTLSAFDLEQQIGGGGATWLDRELASPNRTPLTDAGFGRDVAGALERRQQTLVDIGHATRLPDASIRIPAYFISRLERAEVTRAGRAMAAERGLTFQETKTGEYVSGKLLGSTTLVSGHYALIETFGGDGGLGFSLVPWQPVLEKRIGQHITGTISDGGIEWSFGRKRGLGL